MSLGISARCSPLQEVPKIQILGATAALVQESAKDGGSLVETKEEMMARFHEELVLWA